MFALSDLRLPADLSTPTSSVLQAVSLRTRETLERTGVLPRMPLSKYHGGRFELLTCLAYPHASLDELVLVNDFNMYLFFVDDQAEEDVSYGKHPSRLERYFSDHLAALRSGRPVASDDVAGRLLLDIRARLVTRSLPLWLERFTTDVHLYLMRGTLAGARHWTAGTTPSIAEYARQRGWDSAVYCSLDLLEVAGAGALDEHVRRWPGFGELRRLCTNVVAFTNDLVSYTKEVRRHSSPNNLVHVVMQQRRCSLDEAIAHVIGIINGDADAFERIAAAQPKWSENVQERVDRYLAGARAWMSGNLRWSLASGRYLDAESPFAELRCSSLNVSAPEVHARVSRTVLVAPHG